MNVYFRTSLRFLRVSISESGSDLNAIRRRQVINATDIAVAVGKQRDCDVLRAYLTLTDSRR
jgi:hypothetical protein